MAIVEKEYKAQAVPSVGRWRLQLDFPRGIRVEVHKIAAPTKVLGPSDSGRKSGSDESLMQPVCWLVRVGACSAKEH